VSGPTVEEKIAAVSRYIQMLKAEQKRLSKKIIQNRQDQASARNVLKKLQETKEAGS
jgi:outer membrane murein-binding lipoprotein Lpp